MPYISATAEIMYAPLDLRLVIAPELSWSPIYNKNKSATDHHRFLRTKKAKSVFIRANPWLRVLLSCGLGLAFGRRPHRRLQRMIDEVSYKARCDQNHAEAE